MSAEGRDLPFTRGPGSNPSVGKHSAYLGALEQDTEVQSPKTQIFLQVKTGFFQTQPFTFFGFSFLIFWYCISAVSLLSPMELATPFVIVKGPQMMPNPGRPSPLSHVLATPNYSTARISACIFTGAGVPSEETKLPHPVYLFSSSILKWATKEGQDSPVVMAPQRSLTN